VALRAGHADHGGRWSGCTRPERAARTGSAASGCGGYAGPLGTPYVASAAGPPRLTALGVALADLAGLGFLAWEWVREAAKLIEAIETAGDIASLTNRLRNLEGEIKRIQQAIENHRPVKVDDALNGVRERITKELLGFKESLAAGSDADMTRAKTALAKHIGKLGLTPARRGGRPVYKVTGSVTIPPDGEPEKCRKQLVARDGIEPPTPAFSEL
jgi:hypothetical protein